MAEGIGFTDAQLKRMLAEGGDDNEAEAESAEVAKRKRAERQRLAAARERKKKLAAKKAKEEKARADTQREEEHGETPSMRGAAVRSETPDAAEKEDVSHASSNPWPPQQNNDKTTEVPSAPTAQTNPPKEAVELSQEDVNKNELDQLNRIVKQKQLIEDMNKKKKSLLAEALRARRAKTQAESQALRRIEAELGQIDTFLSHDIAILREKIEEVNREHVKARKRYEEAETEFVAAKIDLHRTSETKEKLTEHLVIIIQENEARKSRKLEELMTKMSLSEEDAIKAADKRMEMEQEAFIREQTRLKMLQEEQQRQQQLLEQQQQLLEQQQQQQQRQHPEALVVEQVDSAVEAVIVNGDVDATEPTHVAGPPVEVEPSTPAASEPASATESTTDVCVDVPSNTAAS